MRVHVYVPISIIHVYIMCPLFLFLPRFAQIGGRA